MKLRSGDYGKGSHVIAVDEDLLIRPDDLRQKLIALFRSPDYQPPTLRSVGIELMELTRNPDVRFDKVLAVLEKDAMVAGRVLKIAQSPVYSPGQAVQSLHQALVRLGLDTLRDIFFEATMRMRVFRAPGYEKPMEALRRHSTATAYVARTVCRYTALSDEYAFLCGLLHDVGIAACVLAVCEGRKKGTEPPPIERLWPAIREAHEIGSETLAHLWQLPPDVKMVLANHHLAKIGGRYHPLAAVIAVADWIASELGFAMQEEVRRAEAEAALASLKLSDEVLARIHEQCAEVIASID